MEMRYNTEVNLRKGTEEALARKKEEVEKLKLQVVNLKIKHENMCIKADDLESKYQSELILNKSLINNTEKQVCETVKRITNFLQDSNASIERDNALKLVHEITKKHEDMCIKAKEFENKYKNKLILTKALTKEKEELEKVKGLIIESYKINASVMEKERDNALKLVDELTTTKIIESFICPISQEVMKDPQLTADGYTYEAEAIASWFNTGHNTSPMTNLKLSHTNLVPNRALGSAIQELV
ncbi:PREDICTED: putative U-box domain-containing protein 58 [Camelina sativa]|uniref:U-box domain-containing protein 58 n=1 Tax=Camelina sativa TaxID=90675 RepID=A0ABM0ZAN0_CAMSA|nr:PREDICTED: putative U-box domain-containing protein 58 [Camelina sativa]